MITQKEWKKLGRNQTIDLKYEMARKYCDDVDMRSIKTRVIDYILIFLVAMWWVFVGFLIFLLFAHNTYADDNIREARIEACKQAEFEYREHIETNWYIHTSQDIIIRCATMMTLVYAKESWYWQSRRCLQDYNCFWIKNMWFRQPLDWINTKVTDNRFLVFESYDDNNLVFARLYMYWNRNKTIDRYVRDWSVTDQGTYINFLNTNYWRVYNELKKLNM